MTNQRFLSTFARRFCGRSNLLDGCTLDIVETGSGVELCIGNRAIVIAYDGEDASIIDGRRFLCAEFDGLEPAVADLVSKFLKRQKITIRKRTA